MQNKRQARRRLKKENSPKLAKNRKAKMARFLTKDLWDFCVS